ncbi:Na/Pi cotransporter family protein [Nesterenkonia marinintestina]|uniref:Na/Pi cotransporter family protein n=1 Tax=Nesterenkonia marinintestina TaxID=2979865 RepID=UPI0021C23A45|nr:Na/Pi cotransporter family protein [Nesterenkonia sp. GX14115]
MSQTIRDESTDSEHGVRQIEVDGADTAAPASPLRRLPLTGRPLRIVEWLAVVAAIYVMITAVGAIGSGFEAATGGQAEELFSFASNPFVALVIGILATALTQSSSTTTSIVVGMVAGGLPIEIAIPMLMGANVGTTMTSTLVSLGAASDREQFRRAFSAASVHDMFNLLAVAILLPIELIFGVLGTIADWFAQLTTGTDGGIVTTIFTAFGDAVSAVTSPGADLIEAAVMGILPEVIGGVLMILLGIALILLIIKFIANMLKSLLVGRAERIFHAAIGRGPISGIGSGALITVMVQSSSTTTSLTVPMAASGKFSLWQIYPFTVGANIGTTMTAMIAAFGFSGVEGTAAMTAAAVHLIYNLFSATIIFAVPFLRPLPVKGAKWLGDLGAKNKMYVLFWLGGLFIVLPAVLIGVSTWVF